MSVYIVDSMMGSGKTSAAIKMMRESSPRVKYLFITPYIKEIKRIIAQCPEKNFREPSALGTKTRGIKYLLKNNENIVATHSLFQRFDDEIVKMIRNGDYTLVMDEVANVIEPLHLHTSDLHNILKNYAAPNPNTNLLEWHDKKYKGVFNNLKWMCEAKSVGVYSEEVLVWLFPLKVFKAFRDIYLMTYMFDAQLQKYYYDLHEVKYKRLSVEGGDGTYSFTDFIDDSDMPCKYEINIFDKKCLNRIGEKETALSKGWYEDNEDKIPGLRNNTFNYFNNHMDALSSKTLWTTFADWKKVISGKGYTRGFVPCNFRATNEYRSRNVVAYLINRYMNPIIRNFFCKYGVTVDENAYALCEMLQFIWRSAIRDGHPIDLYVPSRRMRTLLMDWLEDQEKRFSL